MPARSIRSSGPTVVSQVHGVRPGCEDDPQHAVKRQAFPDADFDFDAQA